MKSVAAFALFAASTLVPSLSAGDITPAPAPAPSSRIVAPIGPKMAVPIKAPKLLYPATGMAFEQTENGGNDVSVYTAWEYLLGPDTLHSFHVCWFKDGQNCGPLGTNHIGLNETQRGYRFKVPIMGDVVKWRFKVGACPGSSADNCTWSEERVLTIFKKWPLIELLEPAQDFIFNFPGTMNFTWKEVPGAEYYLHCNQDRSYTSSYNCTDYAKTQGEVMTVTKLENKPAFGKEFSSLVDRISLFGGQPNERKRGWGVAACRQVQRQQTDQAPEAELSCTHSALRRFTARKP